MTGRAIRLVGAVSDISERKAADQALREALDQQTATAEVLQVINASPGDLAPVFDAMLEKALRLCSAAFGVMGTYDGQRFHSVAERSVPPAYAEFRSRDTGIYGPGTGPARVLAGEKVVHVPDLLGSEPYRRGDVNRRALVDLGGARASLLVPLLRDEAVLGYFMIYRKEAGAFSDKQIALLENFAAQAVIAMENARLITQTREALEKQTAMADILRIISSSPTDVQPTFDVIAASAVRICGAHNGGVLRFDGSLIHLVAHDGWTRVELDAVHRVYPLPPSRKTATARAILTRDVVHIVDPKLDPDFSHASLHQFGTTLSVPMLRHGNPLGAITVTRNKVEAFTEAQIDLLNTFADQAVIAIENVRLFNELNERTDELALRQAELRVTFDNMADGVVMFDENQRLAAWNRNFQELLDLPDAILVERPSYADYLRILAERGEFGADDIEAELNRRLEHTDQELRLERTRPDGRVIEVRRNAVPDGGFVLIYSDITERKRSEAEIRAARDAAEAAYRELKAAQANLVQAEKMASLGQLTAGIAHEIKNPLNFVNNFASLSVELLDELKEMTAPAVGTLGDEKRAEVDETMEMLTGNLEKIAEHGKRADNIVKSMLEHSRGVSGERREVDLNLLVEEALNLAYHGARAQDQSFNITLERDFAGSLKPIEVAPQEITRVFLNLFGNGFYAANKRLHGNGDGSFRPTLTVATREDMDAVEVRVRDNGTGIPPDIREKLFQPFFTTKPTGEGTGLGLSISYDIVTQQHGGTITVDSRVGEFTEFTVRLPRH
jgi:two-component system, NtrC family, sensor kinase